MSKVLSFRCSEELHAKILQMAESLNISVSEVLNQIIDRYAHLSVDNSQDRGNLQFKKLLSPLLDEYKGRSFSIKNGREQITVNTEFDLLYTLIYSLA